MCGKAEKPSFEVAGRASETTRCQRPSERLVLELGLENAIRENLDAAFVQKTAEEW